MFVSLVVDVLSVIKRLPGSANSAPLCADYPEAYVSLQEALLGEDEESGDSGYLVGWTTRGLGRLPMVARWNCYSSNTPRRLSLWIWSQDPRKHRNCSQQADGQGCPKILVITTSHKRLPTVVGTDTSVRIGPISQALKYSR